jgi:hypothetical protein
MTLRHEIPYNFLINYLFTFRTFLENRERRKIFIIHESHKSARTIRLIKLFLIYWRGM